MLRSSSRNTEKDNNQIRCFISVLDYYSKQSAIGFLPPRAFFCPPLFLSNTLILKKSLHSFLHYFSRFYVRIWVTISAMLKLIIHTLLLSISIISVAHASVTQQDCSSKNVELWTKATYATSGSDLVILGKRVRLIGLYSPQREKKQKFNTPAQPLAKEAQLFLNKLLANHDLDVGVEYDTTKIDDFGRQLVHLYLKDGTSVQQKILESGFAINRPAYNNNKYAKCYFEAEQKAREGQFQLWDYLAKHPESHFPLVKSSDLTTQDKGYRIIQGKVVKVMKSATFYIINMDTTGIRIPKRYWDRFDFNKIKQLKGKTIEVRGLAYLYNGVMFMVIEEPNAIDAFNPLHN